MFVPQFYDFRAKRGERGLAVDNAEGGNRVGEFGGDGKLGFRFRFRRYDFLYGRFCYGKG